MGLKLIQICVYKYLYYSVVDVYFFEVYLI